MKLITLVFALVFAPTLPKPAYAEQQAPLQNIAEAYQLMMEIVTDYPANIRDQARYFPPSDGEQFEQYNYARSIIELPEIGDPWRGSYSVLASDSADQFTMINCIRIGQQTLRYMQEYFDHNRDVETLNQTEISQLFLVEQFATVPKNAIAMQVCHLHYPLPTSATVQEEYEALLSTIGDDFTDTKSAEKRLKLVEEDPDRFIDYFFDGSGNLFLNGAAVGSLNATLNDKTNGGNHMPIQMFSVGYLLAPLS